MLNDSEIIKEQKRIARKNIAKYSKLLNKLETSDRLYIIKAMASERKILNFQTNNQNSIDNFIKTINNIRYAEMAIELPGAPAQNFNIQPVQRLNFGQFIAAIERDVNNEDAVKKSNLTQTDINRWARKFSFLQYYLNLNKSPEEEITKADGDGKTIRDFAPNKDEIYKIYLDKLEELRRRSDHLKLDDQKFNEILDEISNDKSQWPFKPSNNTIRYNQELIKYNLIDFDDIIYNFINSCHNLNLPKITHILCDELQDTSATQLEMLKQLQSKLNCNMIGVSDDDQAIYEWRNAKPENVQEFIRLFNCTIYNMGYNFRSDTRIVESSRRLIEYNKKRIPKLIRPFKTSKGHISSYQTKDVFSEIDYVVMKCKQNLNKPIAILYRNRTYKNHLEFALKKAGLKYCVNDALDISDRSSIKVMFSCMKLAGMIGDIYDLEIAMKGIQGIGKVTVTKVIDEVTKCSVSLATVLQSKFQDPKQAKRFKSLITICSWYNANKKKSLDLLAKEIEKLYISSFDYQSEMKNFILDITKNYKINNSDIRDLCNDLGLDGKEEHNDEGAIILLSTVHGWKGLQSKIVIMPWCQQFDEDPNKDYDLEAERRLFYVGITRAEETLFMCYSGNKTRFIREMCI